MQQANNSLMILVRACPKTRYSQKEFVSSMKCNNRSQDREVYVHRKRIPILCTIPRTLDSQAGYLKPWEFLTAL